MVIFFTATQSTLVRSFFYGFKLFWLSSHLLNSRHCGPSFPFLSSSKIVALQLVSVRLPFLHFEWALFGRDFVFNK